MTEAKRIAANDATTGDAAFIRNPISFVKRLVEEGGVILGATGHSVRGAARFSPEENTVGAIYELASTCEWSDHLPSREDQETTSETRVDLAEEEVIRNIILLQKGKLRSVGRTRVIAILDQELGAW
ncbi:hypothetical protein [Jannaschia sp. LMIT008]|uniref:hypothetical protein n=1 Tax=Jannaschia maritima TaxID=3032585 RepID=UPI0028113E49|nr:hypothetical protein [Jannaschia sp. LMIT008]